MAFYNRTIYIKDSGYSHASQATITTMPRVQEQQCLHDRYATFIIGKIFTKDVSLYCFFFLIKQHKYCIKENNGVLKQLFDIYDSPNDV